MVKEMSKKEDKLIHPNSRKAVKLVKKTIWKAKKETRRQHSCQRLSMLGDRLAWLKQNLSDQKVYSLEETHALIERYILRHEEELSQLTAGAGVTTTGRHPLKQTAHHKALLATQRAESDEFSQQGIEFADLTESEAVLNLRVWSGQIKQVPSIKLSRFIRDRLPTSCNGDVQQEATAAEVMSD